jgi:hypothetical protein
MPGYRKTRPGAQPSPTRERPRPSEPRGTVATPSASSRRSHSAASWSTTRHSRHDRHLRQALLR